MSKVYHCQTCTETNPSKFYATYKSICKRCHNKREHQKHKGTPKRNASYRRYDQKRKQQRNERMRIRYMTNSQFRQKKIEEGKSRYKNKHANVALNLGEQQNWKCFYCNIDIKQQYQIDHYIPKAKNGSNDISNLRLACPSCNSRKQDKLPWEFKPH